MPVESLDRTHAQASGWGAWTFTVPATGSYGLRLRVSPLVDPKTHPPAIWCTMWAHGSIVQTGPPAPAVARR